MSETGKNVPKILAPVGGHAQLLAAVRTGADAVYLGAKGFNARRNAENFEEDSLENAVRYCHERGVLVYVTLNTLVADEEFPALLQELDDIAAAKADAVIVQDLGVARLVKRRYPGLPMFASTQTTVHNGEGARLLSRLGFDQVVLARELSLGEIKAVGAASSIHMECFVHGALCMCMSGSCYLSAMLGGRSGNRGLCAQPCRLNFRLGQKEHALSLKDMCLIPHISELAQAGVDALKIEGRMKRPEYVAAAVTGCKAALKGEPPDLETLEAVFSRSGFTNGYFTARRNGAMFGVRTKENVTAAAGVLPRLAALYDQEPSVIPVNMTLCAKAGAPGELSVSDGTHTVSVLGQVAEPARTMPLTEESARKPLCQTGGTPYCVDRLTCQIDDGLALPVSALKAMRRSALSALGELRAERPPYRNTGAEPMALPQYQAPAAPALRLRFASLAQMFHAPEAQAVIFPMEVLEQQPQLIQSFGDRLIVEPPSLCFPDDMPRLRERLSALQRQGVARMTADNLGLVELGLSLGMAVHGDSSLNILNSQALEEFRKLGLADTTLSFELAMSRVRALGGTLPRGILGYGRLTLMKMRACPAKGMEHCGDCPGHNALVDEKNERFPLICRERRYTELLNCVPLYIGDKPFGGVDFVTLRFTLESKEEAQGIYEAFRKKEAPAFRRTGGLYYRELL